ncbi:helix-turn-helix domain-containing protein [Ferrovibrio xuzhouensis]|uniref:Helix-turn-helix domain-containing protein n=1 Tax=Ferrovibrio xuzhouensis TaxID=1576914 RepID=A0ABV7VI42_9PROT
MAAKTPIRAAVPTYALYGETGDVADGNWLHCESIPARSALHAWEIGLHRHRRFFQILNITRGRAECRLGERTVTVRPASVITVTPGLVHGFRFSPDIDGHVITLLAGQVERLPGGAADLRPLLAEPQVVDFRSDRPAAARIAASVAAIAEEFAGSAPGRLGLIQSHVAIVLLTLGRAVAASALDGSGGACPGARHAAAFRTLLDRHYRSERMVAFYAGRLGVSETHLNRICRAAFATSALGAINRRLLLEATRDLTFTMMSVKEIAYSLGFEDPAYFTRFFTRHSGETPTAYRRRHAG